MMSMMCPTWCVIRPPLPIRAGQHAISGVAIPPSWSQLLYLRNGVFEALAHGGSTVR